MLVRMTSGSLGILAFAVAIFRGLYAENPVSTVLLRAWCALIVFLILGAFMGYVAQLVLAEYFKRRTEQVFKQSTEEQWRQAGHNQPRADRVS